MRLGADFSPKAYVEVRAAAAASVQPNDTSPAPPVPFRAAPLDDKALTHRQETVTSRHGVSVGARWRQRRPRDVEDSQIIEREHLLNECAH